MSTPKFERSADDQFKVSEYVYVLSTNDYDIFEARIEKISDDKYWVHYPDWPDDDEVVQGTHRLLKETPKNKQIFERQEKIRAAKEKREKRANRESSSEEDFVVDDEKPAKKPKKKKEPKPKKEKKPKQKAKHKTANPLKIKFNEVLRRAQNQKIAVEAFDDFIKNDFRDDDEVWNNREELKDKYKRISGGGGSNANVGAQKNLYYDESDYSDYGYDYDYESESESEEIKVYDPETIKLPKPNHKDIEKVTELKFNNSIHFQNENQQMSVLFDDDGDSNCFIYKTKDKEYLILNGIKIEIKNPIKVDEYEQYYLYEDKPVSGRPTATSSVFYPTKVITELRSLLRPSSLNLNTSTQQKKNTLQIEDLDEIESRNSRKSSQKSRGNKNFGDDFEGSESD